MINASVITFHTSQEDLHRLLECVRLSPIRKLYVIDYSCNDDLREVAISNNKVNYQRSINLGYGAGHNIAIRKSIEEGADFHVVLNPDVYWVEDVIGKLAVYMRENTDVAQVMPKVFYPDGQLQHLCKLCPSPIDLIAKRFLPGVFTKTRLRRFQLMSSGYDRLMNVPYLSGCFMFFRISAFKEVGLFDERFFMYPEDIDITRRMHARYRTMFYPGASIFHAHTAASKTSARMLWIHIFNMIKYFNKWGWFFDRQREEFNRRLLREISTEEEMLPDRSRC